MVDIYFKINFLKNITMGCGCKNKGNQTPPPQTTQSQPQSTSSQKPVNPTIQESIKKVVEKYYKK